MKTLSLSPEVRALSVAERLAFMEQIWNSIVEDEEQYQLSDAQKAELDRRLADRESDPASGNDWSEVKARILGQS